MRFYRNNQKLLRLLPSSWRSLWSMMCLGMSWRKWRCLWLSHPRSTSPRYCCIYPKCRSLAWSWSKNRLHCLRELLSSSPLRLWSKLTLQPSPKGSCLRSASCFRSSRARWSRWAERCWTWPRTIASIILPWRIWRNSTSSSTVLSDINLCVLS